MSTGRSRVAKHSTNGALLKRTIFDHSVALSEQLNFTQLLPKFLTPKYKFLSDEEVKQLNELPTDQQKANELLVILKTTKRSSRKLRKFLACVFDENEHAGHVDLSKLFQSVLPPEEIEKIRKLMSQKPPIRIHRCGDRSVLVYKPQGSKTVADGPRPELPMTLIQYEGCLVKESYYKLDRELWDSFSTGRYDKLETLTQRIDASMKVPIDVKIIGKWFQALISMHRDGSYEICLNNLLQPALEMCSGPNIQNRNILEGRICQRMAQVYLVMGKKEDAMTYFDRANELLQFVARGYDKVNMFCRQAKIMCATMPEKRKEIEETFCRALENVSDDDSFALASKPSIILSKAAFHLRISFGSKPSISAIEKSLLPNVCSEDIKKARGTLNRLQSSEVLLTMRKCEFKFLEGELLRHEGKIHEASQIFKEVICESKAAKLPNIVASAQHHLDVMEQEKEWDQSIEEILDGCST